MTVKKIIKKEMNGFYLYEVHTSNGLYVYNQGYNDILLLGTGTVKVPTEIVAALNEYFGIKNPF